MGDSSETQERIIAASLKLFAEKGYHGTRTSEIARESGVAEATVFKYFRTKKILLASVLQKIIADILPGIAFSTAVDFAQIKDPASGKTYLKAVLLEKIRQIRENFSAFRVLVTELQYHDDLKKTYLDQLVPSVIKMLEGFYTQGVEAGAFRKIDPHIAARSFLGSIVVMILEDVVLKKNIDFDHDLEAILDLYAHGIGIRKEAREND